jgi:hypothetical protein
MKKQILMIALFSMVSLITYAQIACRPLCTSTATQIPDANIVLRTMSGGTVTQILPNTQYQLRITQPSGSNSFWEVCPGGGFGFTQASAGFAEDAAAGQVRTRTITSDSAGGIMVIEVYGGAGGGVSPLCLSTVRRDSFPE